MNLQVNKFNLINFLTKKLFPFYKSAEIKKFFEPVLQRKFLMSELALVGEGHDGNFHVICRTPFGQKSKK